MTIKFHTNIRNSIVGNGLLVSGINAASGITIYSGVQPAASSIVANWSAYNSTNTSFLAHYTGAVWTQPLDGAATFASLTTIPAATNATNSGTGTWCIIWCNNPTGPQLASATLPSTTFIVAPVGTMTTTGVIRFVTDTIFTAGIAKTISNGVINVTST